MKEQTQSGDENNKETSRYNKCGKEGEITYAGFLVRETNRERCKTGIAKRVQEDERAGIYHARERGKQNHGEGSTWNDVT